MNEKKLNTAKRIMDKNIVVFLSTEQLDSLLKLENKLNKVKSAIIRDCVNEITEDAISFTSNNDSKRRDRIKKDLTISSSSKSKNFKVKTDSVQYDALKIASIVMKKTKNELIREKLNEKIKDILNVEIKEDLIHHYNKKYS